MVRLGGGRRGLGGGRSNAASIKSYRFVSRLFVNGQQGRVMVKLGGGKRGLG